MALVSRRSLSELPQAREFFKRALQQDPEYGAAHAMAAWTFVSEQALSGLPLSAQLRTEALRFASFGSRLANDDALTLARSGHVLTYLGHEYDRGASMVEQAVALNPNLAIAWHSLDGWHSCAVRRNVPSSFDRMIKLSPRPCE
jgi:adenylate cyclase